MNKKNFSKFELKLFLESTQSNGSKGSSAVEKIPVRATCLSALSVVPYFGLFAAIYGSNLTRSEVSIFTNQIA